MINGIPEEVIEIVRSRVNDPWRSFEKEDLAAAKKRMDDATEQYEGMKSNIEEREKRLASLREWLAQFPEPIKKQHETGEPAVS